MTRMKRIAMSAAAVAAVAAAIPAGASPSTRPSGTQSTTCNDGTLSWTPTTISPPNHSAVPFAVSYRETNPSTGKTDGDNDKLSLAINSISDNQGSGQGSGKTEADWGVTKPSSSMVAEDQTATVTGWVRAERAGSAGSRVYSIVVTCTDTGGEPMTTPAPGLTLPIGNEGQQKTVTITVPHDRRGH